MKSLITILMIVSFAFTAAAQLQEGKENIDKLCGCFGVDFKYVETFSPDPLYKFHTREELSGLELALPIERSDKKIVIQHLLVVGDSMIVKHWREDWEFESPYLWKYEGDKKWVKIQLKPEEYKNKWTQTIWEVDDAPRYQGISNWVTTDNKTFWQSTVDAPLPRREYSTRNDYNILRRGNRLIITPLGWTHEQDNEKIISTNGTTQLIAQEKGYNTYTKEADKECAYAKTWWEKNSAFWSKVRTEWQNVISAQTTISLQSKVNNKGLNESLTELSKKFNKQEINAAEASTQIRELLAQFIGVSNKTAGR